MRRISNFIRRSCSTNTAVKIATPEMPHVPIMLQETLRYVNLTPGNTMVDMTFGGGGHSEAILKLVPDVKIYALDRDPVAYEYAENLAKKYPGQVIPLLGKFSDLPNLLKPYRIKKNSIDTFLFDFGVSNMQTNAPERGFNTLHDGPLDMRMDGSRDPEAPMAYDVLSTLEEEDVYRLLKYYGEEKKARMVAKALMDAKYNYKNLKTTHQLARVIATLTASDENLDLSLIARTFRAIRMFVNNEINEINYAMLLAERYLKIHGRLITISLTTLEDMVVKRHLCGNISETVANTLPLKFFNMAKTWDSTEDVMNLTESAWKMLHPHIIVPSDVEIEENPRAKAAKFRAIIKIK